MKQEALRSIHGALRLFRADPTTLGYFNLSFEGFVRSFAAILIVYPLYLVSVGVNYSRIHEVPDGNFGDPLSALDTPGMFGWLVMKSIIFLLSWASYPLAMVPISRLLRLDPHYVQYIIVWNWANVIATLIWLPALMFAALGNEMEGGGMLLLYLAQAVAFYYAYRVARIGLCAPLSVAIGLVIFEFALTLLIDSMLQRIIF